MEFTNQDWTTPKVVGFKGGPKPCPFGTFISGATIYFFDMEGDPYAGTLAFTNKRTWGTASHVWFLNGAYWVLDGGAVKANFISTLIVRDAGNEQACTGLPAGVTEFNVALVGGTYYLTASVSDMIKRYSSSDGLAWTHDSDPAFSGGSSRLTSVSKVVTGAGWFEMDSDRYHVEVRDNSGETGYPGQFFRLYRIGKEQRWDANGEAETTVRAWTMCCDANDPLAEFEEENDFTVEGGFSGLQLIQVHWPTDY